LEGLAVIVDSCNMEFGYELLTAVPYAYYLHTQGKLKGTVSGIGSEPLYWFSPDHRINPKPRGWDNIQEFRNSGMPNVWIHRPEFDMSQFAAPPFREQYGKLMRDPAKPIVCICNRYNREWNGPPINYLDLECLARLFEMLKGKYQVIYWAVDLPDELQDGVRNEPLEDVRLIRNRFPEVVLFQDLLELTGMDWNTLQLTLFSKCEKFITMNGGYSILASYFGGVNIIYSKKCREIEPKVNSFYRWYHKLGGSRIIHADSYYSLYRAVKMTMLESLPMVNILIRTSGRPNFFNECMRSIREQTYKNVNVIVGTDDEASAQYVTPYKVIPVRYIPNKDIPDAPVKLADGRTCYGKKAHYNLYLNELAKEVRDGWVLYLDDDAIFSSPGSLEEMMRNIHSDKDFILPRVNVAWQNIPNDQHWGGAPYNCDITGVFLFHSKYLKHAVWEPYRKGNFRVASVLYKKLNPVWINKIMIRTIVGNGTRQDIAKQTDKLYL